MNSSKKVPTNPWRKRIFLLIILIAVIITGLLVVLGSRLYKWGMGFDYFLPKANISDLKTIATINKFANSNGQESILYYCNKPSFSQGKIMWNSQDNHKIKIQLYDIETQKYSSPALDDNLSQCGLAFDKTIFVYAEFASGQEKSPKFYWTNINTLERHQLDLPLEGLDYGITLTDKYLVYFASKKPSLSEPINLLNINTLESKAIYYWNDQTAHYNSDNYVAWMDWQSKIHLYNISTAEIGTVSTGDKENESSFFSIMGDKIYFLNDRNCIENIDGCSGEDIYEYDLRTKQTTKITTKVSYYSSPIVEKNILLSSLNTYFYAGTRSSIYLKNLTTNKEYILSSHTALEPQYNSGIETYEGTYAPLGIYNNKVIWKYQGEKNYQIFSATLQS